MTTSHNEEEEDKKKQSNEEDFGLPDFEFEELGDEEEEVGELPEISEPETSFSEETYASSTEEASPTESTEEDSSSSIFGSDDPEHYKEEVSYEGGDFGSESTYEEPEYPSEYQEENVSSIEDEWVPKYRQEDTGNSKKFILLIVLGLILMSVVAFAILYIRQGDNEVAEAENVLEEPTAPVATAVDTTANEAVAVVEETPPPKEEPSASVPAANPSGTGEIAVISERTGRTYVVVGSFFDRDLADDLSKRISSQGRDVKIIEPKGGQRFHRVAVADYATYSEAVNVSERFKSEFGPEVWALKY